MSAILDFFSTIYHFLASLIQGLLWVCTNLPRLQMMLFEVFAYAPPWLNVFLTLCLSLLVAFGIIKLIF